MDLLRLRFRFPPYNHILLNRNFNFQIQITDEMLVPKVLSHHQPIHIIVKLATVTKEHKSENMEELFLETDKYIIPPSATYLKIQTRIFLNRNDSNASLQDLQLRCRFCIRVDNGNNKLDTLTSSMIGQAINQLDIDVLWRSWYIIPLYSDVINIHGSTNNFLKSAQRSQKNTRFIRMRNHNTCLEENYGKSMGSHLWDTSFFLTASLLSLDSLLNLESNKLHVIELGAGIGLCGLACCILSRVEKVVITDKKENLILLQQHVKTHSLKALASELQWGNRDNIIQCLRMNDFQPFDMLFGSDLLYNWEQHKVLLETISQLTGSQSTILIAQKYRGKKLHDNLTMLQQDKYICLSKCCQNQICPWERYRLISIIKWNSMELFQLSTCS